MFSCLGLYNSSTDFVVSNRVHSLPTHPIQQHRSTAFLVSFDFSVLFSLITPFCFTGLSRFRAFDWKPVTLVCYTILPVAFSSPLEPVANNGHTYCYIKILYFQTSSVFLRSASCRQCLTLLYFSWKIVFETKIFFDI